MIGVSIIVCCYNSAKLLPSTINHLAKQIVDSDIQWEVIIIDNASTDQTSFVAKEELNKYGELKLRSKVIYEPKPGLTNARHKGFVSANYDYVIMCDDDNLLDDKYVNIVFDIMSANIKVGALGGVGYELLEIDKPDWFDENKATFAVGSFSSLEGNITNTNNGIYGAGATIRKSAYLELIQNDFKSVTTDRIGNKLTSGGDTELFWALELLGYEIWFSSRLVFTHFIQQKALLMKNFISKMYYGTRSEVKLRPYTYIKKNKAFLKRSKLKKDWKWLAISHIIPFFTKFHFVDILIYKVKPNITRRTIDAHISLGKIVQIVIERNKNLETYNQILNSKWYKKNNG